MALAKIKDNHLEYNGINYFRAGSEETDLGSYGNKRTPLTRPNYLEVYKTLPFERLKIKDAVTVQIEKQNLTEADFVGEGKFKVLGLGASVSSKTAFQKIMQAELELLKFSVNAGDMVDAVNASPVHRDNIIELGNDARLVHVVFSVVDAKIAKAITAAKQIDASAEKGNLHLTAHGSGSASSKTEVTFDDESVFAYLLLKLEWDHERKAKRTKAVSAHDDQWSLG